MPRLAQRDKGLNSNHVSGTFLHVGNTLHVRLLLRCPEACEWRVTTSRASRRKTEALSEPCILSHALLPDPHWIPGCIFPLYLAGHRCNNGCCILWLLWFWMGAVFFTDPCNWRLNETMQDRDRKQYEKTVSWKEAVCFIFFPHISSYFFDCHAGQGAYQTWWILTAHKGLKC